MRDLVDKFVLEYAYNKFHYYEVEWFSLRNTMCCRIHNELIEAFPELSGSLDVWIDEHPEYSREMPKMHVKVPMVAIEKVKEYLYNIYDNISVEEWKMKVDY